MKRGWFSVVLLSVSLIVLMVGLSKLVELRFESGEAYPVRSSLRPDPLGSKVLFESYDAQPGLTVSRNFAPFKQLNDLSPDAALLLLNVLGWDLYHLALYDSVQTFVEGGGRLVVALNADQVAYRFVEMEEESGPDSEDATESEEDSVDDEEESDATFRRKPGTEEKHFWGELSLIHGEREETVVQRVGGDFSDLPAELPWRQGGTLEDLGEEWIPVYAAEDEVVAALRQFGEGSIVVLTDDYLFSNEAMLKHRFPDFLIWILGGKGTVVFDETHLGVTESVGIATLIRRYHLSGFFVVLILFLLLVVWRGASPLLPPYARGAAENMILADHSSQAGLGDLVRRSIPVADMPREAYRKWKSTFIKSTTDQQFYADQLAEVEAVLTEQASTSSLRSRPLQTHLRIKSIINRKKRKHS